MDVVMSGKVKVMPQEAIKYVAEKHQLKISGVMFVSKRLTWEGSKDFKELVKIIECGCEQLGLIPRSFVVKEQFASRIKRNFLCTCVNFQGEHEEDCQTRF